jgi:hypothetical protein
VFPSPANVFPLRLRPLAQMKVLSLLLLAAQAQTSTATGNFCQTQANYLPNALTPDGDACSAKMDTYETIGGITDWTTQAECATVVGGHPFSAHLTTEVRSCCTDGKHVCDVGQGNLCKDQTKFSPNALAKDGQTCMAKELEYEAAGLFDIASWTTVYAAGECASKTFGGHALKVHLDDQTAACCTSSGNICAALPTTAAPVSHFCETVRRLHRGRRRLAFIVAVAVAMHR